MSDISELKTSVNFNVDVNKLISDIFKRSTRNDLLVITQNGMLSGAEVHFGIDPGGHGDLAQVKGSEDISAVNTSQASVTAQYCAVGIHAVGAGSNALFRIPVGRFVLNLIAATPVNKENYIKYSVTEELHSHESMRARVEKCDKHFANHGTVEIKMGDKVAWVTMTAVSPATCRIELRETSGLSYS